MKVSRNWLSDFVKVDDYKALASEFNLKSMENTYYKLVTAKKLVVGHVLELEDHPNANKLHVLKVDVKDEVLQIICGAPNVKKGQKVIVALVGATLPGNVKIRKSKIRGIESCGMCCSLEELGLDMNLHNEYGIHVLPPDAPVGEDVLKYMGLDDEIMELDLTPNRGDLLSIMGVAIDVGAITNQRVEKRKLDFPIAEEKNNIKIVLDTDKCLQYNARLVKNIKIKESPMWLKVRLMASGIRPINNVVDITNYVLMETGQPMHAFDYDLFGSDTVLVRNANAKESFVTLDDVTRVLTNEDIVITNGQEAKCLAGVMGGKNSAINDETKNVLLESAIFDPISIRKTSGRLNLRSDSSMRYEKGVDANRTIYALDLACKLLVDLAEATVTKGTATVCNQDLSDKLINIKMDYLSRLVGIEVSKASAKDIYERLGFKVEDLGDSLNVYVPVRRNDIAIKQDLVEEYIRIYGMNNIPSTLPKNDSVGGFKASQILKRKVKNTLLGLGLSETITYSLIKEKDVYDYTTKEVEYIKVLSPLSEDRAVMRLSPLNGLVEVLSYNANRKLNNLALFEISDIYSAKQQTRVLSLALTGIQSQTTHQGSYERADFYYIKGIIARLAKEARVSFKYVKPETTNKNFNINQTAYIYLDNKYVGFITKLHPQKAKEFDLQDVYLAEISTQAFVNNQKIQFEEIQKYPEITRDIAIVTKKDVVASDIIEVIKEAGKKLLTSVVVFDVYTGAKVKPDEKSIALKLTFSDKNKTLEVNEVNERMDKIMKKLSAFGAKLR